MKTSLPNWLCSRYAGLYVAALLIPLTAFGQTTTRTDLELSLVIDTSGSVDTSEFNLQLGGYAAAFRNPSVQAAISNGAIGNIAVNTLFFDSNASPGLDWRLLTSASDATAFANALAAIARPSSGGTNPASGINAALAAITGNSYNGTRKVIDVSGDGVGNAASDKAARDAALAGGVNAINGLAINLSATDKSIEDYYRANIVGGNKAFTEAADDFTDFERAIIAKLKREIAGQPPAPAAPTPPPAPPKPDDRLVSTGLRPITISINRAMSRDVGGRLAMLRSGGLGDLRVESSPPVQSSPKGGFDSSSKGGVAVIPSTSVVDRVHLWGDVYYLTKDFDRQTTTTPTGGSFLVAASSELDIFGGTVGADYRFNKSLTLGLAFGASDASADIKGVADIDIESMAIMPYISYYRRNAVGSADVWADLLYTYVDSEYDFKQGGVSKNFDGNAHQIEFNTGLNFKAGEIIHGPFTQLRYANGEVDTGVDFDSLATQLGYHVSKPVSFHKGILIPHARVAWEHEFRSDQGTLAGIDLGDLDEDVFVGGFGMSYILNNGWNIGYDYEARLGSNSDSHYIGVRAGLRF